MIPFEEIAKYLPRYLTATSEKELFAELKAFPENLDQRFYTTALHDEPALFQGDGLRDLLVINLPDPTIRATNCMIFSNTCDIDPQNKKPIPASLCYARIFRLKEYSEMLQRRRLKQGEALDNHLLALRRQMITQVFYLPSGGKLDAESFVFLDRICHCPSDSVPRDGVSQRRIFTLSNYGAYLFLLKLSIHFTRLTDQVDRSAA